MTEPKRGQPSSGIGRPRLRTSILPSSSTRNPQPSWSCISGLERPYAVLRRPLSEYFPVVLDVRHVVRLVAAMLAAGHIHRAHRSSSAIHRSPLVSSGPITSQPTRERPRKFSRARSFWGTEDSSARHPKYPPCHKADPFAMFQGRLPFASEGNATRRLRRPSGPSSMVQAVRVLSPLYRWEARAARRRASER